MSARQLAGRVQLAVCAVVLALAAAASSRALAHRERAMWDEETSSTRLVTYALTPGDSLRVPIEPGTDVVRVVAHAYRRGALAAAGHRASLRVGTSEPLDLVAPGSVARAQSEEQGIAVGDPVAFNVDASGHAPEVSIKLESISEADGMLVRVYRRESLLEADALRRRSSVSAVKREHLASRAGELDWVDLSANDRATLIGARWQKLAPLPSEARPFRPWIISLSPAPAAEPALLAAVEAVALGRGDVIGGVVTGPNRLVMRAADPAAHLSLLARDPETGEQRLSGVGTVELGVARDKTLEFQVATEAPTNLSVLAGDRQRVQLSSDLEYDRVAPERPALVQAVGYALVLRVDARRRVSKNEPTPATSLLLADVTGEGRTISYHVEIKGQRAHADRYVEGGEPWVPSESARFYLLVPARGRVTLRPASGDLDLTLAELEPEGTGRRFVARRPTNWRAFAFQSHGTLRIARRPMQAGEPVPSQPVTLHVTRPRVLGSLKRDGRMFVPGSTIVRFDVRAGGPNRLFLHLLSDRPTEVSVLVDGAEPRRRSSGLATSITTGRVIHVDGEAKLSLLIGDDLAAGTHAVSFGTSQGTLLVHAPWTNQPKLPSETAWVAGDFEQ